MYSNNNLVSIDDGGHSVCIVSKGLTKKFPSVKGYLGERRLTKVQGEYDFIVEYKGESYVMGTLAKYDCSMPLKMFTDTKQHIFYDLSVLTALHQYGYSVNKVIITVPIEFHTDEEKQGRINRLKGMHTIKVNGITKTFTIEDVKVAPESATAFWVNKPRGMSRYLDLGSRTVGYSTVLNEDGIVRFIDSQSGTFLSKGIEALGDNYNPNGLADFICGNLSKFWNRDDAIYLLGGGCHDTILVNKIKEYFPNAMILDKPDMQNAMGSYQLGRIAYGYN